MADSVEVEAKVAEDRPLGRRRSTRMSVKDGVEDPLTKIGETKAQAKENVRKDIDECEKEIKELEALAQSAELNRRRQRRLHDKLQDAQGWLDQESMGKLEFSRQKQHDATSIAEEEALGRSTIEREWREFMRNIEQELEALNQDRQFRKVEATRRIKQADKPQDTKHALVNRAFVFIKPHAVTPAVVDLVKAKFGKEGLRIVSEGTIDGDTIASNKLIDNHYYSIAEKASLKKPGDLIVSMGKQEEFQKKFGLSWPDAVSQGLVLNALDASKKMGIDGTSMETLWLVSKNAGKFMKFGGGFYCALISTPNGSDGWSGGSVYVINGFYMSMRDKYTKQGSSIYHFLVEWESSRLSWRDFRGTVLGSTDPGQAEIGSLRRTVFDQWQSLGLSSEPNVGDNGLHASASPFEGLGERMNWLGVNLLDDDFGSRMLADGISEETIMAWTKDPQLEFQGKKQSIFDVFEDFDAEECIFKAQSVAGINHGMRSTPNQAFVFVKPHAVTPAVVELVETEFTGRGLRILSEGTIEGPTIASKKYIDQHYYSIANKASLTKPADLVVPMGKQEEFEKKFGQSWPDVLSRGLVYNAVDACNNLGITGVTMESLWLSSKKAEKFLKIGGGFYVAQISTPTGMGAIYVINGFYMAMREKYTKPEASIHYFLVEWDWSVLSWRDFRGIVLGSTDPALAEPGSLRRLIFDKWESLGLSAQPNVGDNGLHASASPFEALAERINWLEASLKTDPFGSTLLAAGVTRPAVMAWTKDPQLEFQGKKQSLFDVFEDLDSMENIFKARLVAGMHAKSKQIPNQAFVFIKPHAITPEVIALVKAKFDAEGFLILREGSLGGPMISSKKLIDNHYYSIANKASLTKPKDLVVPMGKQEEFEKKFGCSWPDAISSGQVYNAVDACSELDIGGVAMEKMWLDSKAEGKFLKLAGGFYVAALGGIYVINGFYMSMRDKYTNADAKIEYFLVEWNSSQLSWQDFRGTLLGCTDPAQAEIGSLRRSVYDRWDQLGLKAQPNVGDNGLHASASPFESLAERMNWLGLSLADDDFGTGLVEAGVVKAIVNAWTKDPQLEFQGKKQSLFDIFEDLDAEECIFKAKTVAGIGTGSDPVPNEAFLFIKPHAVTPKTIELVKGKLENEGLRILKEGILEGPVIESKKLIDQHYYSIANKASLNKPDVLFVPMGKQEEFQKIFGHTWADAISKGMIYNAVDACAELNIDGTAMASLWLFAKNSGRFLKLGGGFYVAELNGLYVINGFYMSMREKYTKSDASIAYFLVEWDASQLSWKDFRGAVLGCTDPEQAEIGSLRRSIVDNWEMLGLTARPNVGDNGLHASASPFEGMAERINWLESGLQDDTFGRPLLASGVKEDTIMAWTKDPSLEFQGKKQSIFDVFEDLDAEECILKAKLVSGHSITHQEFQKAIQPSGPQTIPKSEMSQWLSMDHNVINFQKVAVQNQGLPADDPTSPTSKSHTIHLTNRSHYSVAYRVYIPEDEGQGFQADVEWDIMGPSSTKALIFTFSPTEARPFTCKGAIEVGTDVGPETFMSIQLSGVGVPVWLT